MQAQVLVSKKLQGFMLSNGMFYSLAQLVVFVFAGLLLVPHLSAFNVDGKFLLSCLTFGDVLKVMYYMMAIPPLFFLLFLGAIYDYFKRNESDVKSILVCCLLSGIVMIIIWPIGALVSLLQVDLVVWDKGIAGGSLDSITPYSLGLTTVPRSVFLCSLSALLVEKKALSYSGFLLGLGSLCGTLVLLSEEFLLISFLMAIFFHIWTFCCSLVMYRSFKEYNSIRKRSTRKEPQSTEYHPSPSLAIHFK